MGLAARAQGARRRRCGDIVDDEQRRDRAATPMRPKGSGGAWASASLALLDNVPALPASRRLASAHAALGTRHILILGQAPRLRGPFCSFLEQICYFIFSNTGENEVIGTSVERPHCVLEYVPGELLGITYQLPFPGLQTAISVFPSAS
jgi:hypothetical protein